MEGYATHILHRAPVVFGDRNLVILSKWVGKTESLLKVGKALLGDFKYVLSINVFKKRFAGIDSERNYLLALVFIVNAGVGTGHNGSDVGGDHLRCGELSKFLLIAKILC